jgi:tellurite resistance protein TerC
MTGPNNKVVLSDALRWSLVWIMLALGFDGLVYYRWGRGPAVVWFTSYLLEKFLSIDNLFVFLTIFASFRTPARFQHRVRVCFAAILD